MSSANKIANGKYKYNLNEDKNCFKNYINYSSQAKNQLKADLKTKIIFIVGMPRSGTALVEQILSAHKKVYEAGELSFLSDAINNAS